MSNESENRCRTVAALYVDPRGPWGRLRHMYRGTEHDCAPRAVDQVRLWGGVLEHPWGSLLWPGLGLPKPGELPDAWGGRSLDVCQCDWGHPARKRTWLYVVAAPLPTVYPHRREPTHWISGGRGRAGKKVNTTPVPPGIKVCSAQQRRRTPPAFAAWLVALARTVPQDWRACAVLASQLRRQSDGCASRSKGTP